MKRFSLIQPLPRLVYRSNVEMYSEFSSLGLAILGNVLQDAGHEVTSITYPSRDQEIQNSVQMADTIILGDFRYYAYFCNPYPLIKHTLEVLTKLRFSNAVLLGGRHSRFFPKNFGDLQNDSPFKLHLSPNMKVLSRLIGLPAPLAAKLGNDVLPSPGYVSPKLLSNNGLVGSVSRPTSKNIGQLILNAGCRYRCAFCEKADSPFVYFPLKVLNRQLQEFKEAGLNYLIVWDEVFGQDEDFLNAVLNTFYVNKIQFSINTRIDVITDRFVDQLASSGCKAVLFGVETANWEREARRLLTLDRAKSPRITYFRHVIELLKSYNIDAFGSIIIGLPEDTRETIKTRLKTCSQLGFTHLYVHPLVPFPESSIYKIRMKKGLLESYENWQIDGLNTYPHGYPILCSNIKREELCSFIQQAI